MRGPGINNFNFALFKRTRINERFNLEFRSEVFNLFNRVQFGQPNRVATTSATSARGRPVNNPGMVALSASVSGVSRTNSNSVSIPAGPGAKGARSPAFSGRLR